jgi:hypothetical protein
MAGETVSAATIINGPAEAIFAVLAGLARHAAIGGTGWVREALDSKPLTAAGQVFGLTVYHAGHRAGTIRWPAASRRSTRRASSPGSRARMPMTAACGSAAGSGATA